MSVVNSASFDISIVMKVLLRFGLIKEELVSPICY